MRYANLSILCAVAAIVTACSQPQGEDQTCTIDELQSGETVITCGDESVTIAPPAPPEPEVPCYRGLPDLSGDGVLDGADCSLVGVGAVMRSICSSEPRDWMGQSECRTSHSVGVANGTPFVAYWQDRAFALITSFGPGPNTTWLDANDDSVPQPVEFHNSDTPGLGYVRRLQDDGPFLFAFGTLGFWLDRDRDSRVDPIEVKSYLEIFPGIDSAPLGPEQLVAYARDDGLVAIFALLNSRVDGWIDADTDLAIDVSELHSFSLMTSLLVGANGYSESSGMPLGLIFIDYNGVAREQRIGLTGQLGVQYTIGSTGLGLCQHSLAHTTSGLICRIRSGGWLFGPVGSLNISPGRADALRWATASTGRPVPLSRDFGGVESTLWIDLNVDGVAAPHELATLPDIAASDAAFSPSRGLLASDHRTSSIWTARPAAAFLGEQCEPLLVLQCAEGLRCAMTGEAPLPHCVP